MAGGSDETEVVSVLNEYGHRIYVDPTDQRGAKLVAAGGSLNPHSLDLWRAALALGPWDLVVDVGANYGEMLAVDELSTAPAIVAVEPNSKVLGYLEHTLDELDWAVDLEVRAVSSSSATNVPLMVPDAYSGTATLRPEQVEATTEAWTTVPVETTTLDELLLGRGCRNACIKIDIEGEELRALHGAAEAFRTLERVAVMVEILHMPVQTVAKLAREFPLFLLERETGRLVRAEGRDLDELGGQLYSGEVNWQDALLLTGTDGKQFAAEVQQQNSRRVAKRVVYTALFGDYEELQDQPVAAESDIPFICFTDNPSLTSDTWEVRLVEAALPKDSVRSARKLKVQGHPTLAEYDERIWVDNRVTLKADPSVILDDLLAEHDMALFEHSFRATVADEFDAVAAGGYDDSSRVYEQLLHYAEVDPDVLDAKPLWTGFMARRMTAPVRAAMEQWMDHILRYSRRDQLSVNLALAQHSVPTRHLEGSNRESEFHAWPPVSPALGRRAEKNHEAFAHAVRAPLLRLRALERDTADLIEAHKLAATKRDALIEKLSKQARQTERERNLALKERDKARAQVVALRSRVTRLRGRLAAVRATGDGAGPAGRGSTAPSGADTRAREGAARRGLRSLAARPTPRRLARRLPGPVKRRLHGYARQAEGQGSPRGGRRNTVG